MNLSTFYIEMYTPIYRILIWQLLLTMIMDTPWSWRFFSVSTVPTWWWGELYSPAPVSIVVVGGGYPPPRCELISILWLSSYSHGEGVAPTACRLRMTFLPSSLFELHGLEDWAILLLGLCYLFLGPSAVHLPTLFFTPWLSHFAPFATCEASVKNYIKGENIVRLLRSKIWTVCWLSIEWICWQ
jgi:hypothetical protein